MVEPDRRKISDKVHVHDGDPLVIISISVDAKELRRFDEVARQRGFTSRSDAIREAMHAFVAQNRLNFEGEAGKHFLMSVVYEEKKKHSVLDIIHRHSDIILSATHTHFDGKCAEQLVLTGSPEQILQMLDSLRSVKDVRICNCLV
jgi:CopG family nickel-responsive transcriptional regulator